MSRIGHTEPGAGTRPTADELREAREEAERRPGQPATGSSAGAKKVTAADAERMVSQAGYARAGAKKQGSGPDLGEASRGPVPLPEDDVDASAWSIEGLAEAQGQLLGHTVQLRRGRARARGGLREAFAALARGEADADEDGDENGDPSRGEAALAERHARLQALLAEAPPPPPAMAALAKSVHAQFGIDFAASPPGAALMATSLLVAGHPEGVQVAAAPGGQELVADPLLQGLQRVVEEGHAAADDARRRSEGVHKNLAMHRTFVPRR